MAVVKVVDSLIPGNAKIRDTMITTNTVGRLMMPETVDPSASGTVKRRHDKLGWQRLQSLQKTDEISAPADGNRGGAYGIFQHKIPTDNPGR